MAATSTGARCHCFYQGRVQGVGFRFTCRNLAIGFDVAGFVRNLPDGRVELLAEGPSDQVDGFVRAVAERMRSAIVHVHRTTGPASGDFRQFVIAR